MTWKNMAIWSQGIFLLLLGSDQHDDCACMGVARIVESRVDMNIIQDDTYLPPLLDCQFAPTIVFLITELQDLLHHRGEILNGEWAILLPTNRLHTETHYDYSSLNPEKLARLLTPSGFCPELKRLLQTESLPQERTDNLLMLSVDPREVGRDLSERYFDQYEFKTAHPLPDDSGPIYHDLDHTFEVAGVAYVIPKSLGDRDEQAELMGQMGLIHDIHDREGGVPPNAMRTYMLLECDIMNGKPLIGQQTLRERFGWEERELHIAQAFVARTHYPRKSS